MAHTRKERHRDRDQGRRQFDEEPPGPNRVFRLTDAERQDIVKSLRDVDEARRALEAQQNRENREIIRELRSSADHIFDIVNALDEIDPD